MIERKKRVLTPDTVLPMSYSAAAMFSRVKNPGVPANYDWDQFDFKEPENLSEFWEQYSMRKSSNWFMTNAARARLESRFAETDRPLDLLTIVCPPYSKHSLKGRGNRGLMTDFSDNLVFDHNFEYDYRVIAHCLWETGQFLEKQGLQVNMKYIIGDWALRDATGVREMFPTDTDIQNALSQFAVSAQGYMDVTYPQAGIQIDRFMNTSIPENFPLDIPHSPEGKRDHMLSVLNTKPTPFLLAIRDLMRAVDSGNVNLEPLTDPSSWKSIGAQYAENPQTIVRLLQVFRNTAMSRKTEIGANNTTMDPYQAGFWDAVLKAYEYVLYASEFKAKYPDSVKAFFDTKYPASGLFFEEGGLDLMYLDPQRFYIPKSELRIPFNPF